MMKALPNTSFLPVPKSAPAGHTTAVAHLLWQVFPRYPCLEYKDNSGQSCPVRYTWTASFGPGLIFWQKWFNLTPQFVAYQFPGHLLHPHWYFTAYSSICQVLLGALKQLCKISFQVIILVVSIILIANGKMSTGSVITVCLLFQQLIKPIDEVYRFMDETASSVIKAKALLEVISSPSDEVFVIQTSGEDSSNSEIRIDNVVVTNPEK